VLIKRTKDGEPYIDPARLRVPITFLQMFQPLDSSGVTTSWAPASPPDIAYSAVEPIRAADIIKAGLDVSKVWLNIYVRYRNPGRQATEHVQDDSGNIYVIRAVENIDPGRKVYQILSCELIGTNV
jgi:head-tail adaptor